VKTWHEGETRFVVNSGGRSTQLDAFPSILVKDAIHVKAPLIKYPGDAQLDQVTNAIVVVDYTLGEIRPETHLHEAVFVHDPSGTLLESRHVIGMPHASRSGAKISRILEKRPAAVVIVLRNYFDSCQFYGAHQTPRRGLDISDDPAPCIWVGPNVGEQLDRILDAGNATAELNLSCRSERVVTHNIMGFLPGNTDEFVQIASHHDGAFVGATEDAAGVALVLAQARYWSQIPREQRPHTLAFLLTTAHLKGAVGEATMIKAYHSQISKTILDIHLETPAIEYDIQNHELVNLERPEPRYFYVSRNRELQKSVIHAIQCEDLRRSMVFHADTFAQPRCAAGRFFLAGVPVVGFISGPPVYYFDAQDTIDKVDRAALVPITRATVRMINATFGQTAATMRQSETPTNPTSPSPRATRERTAKPGAEKEQDAVAFTHVNILPMTNDIVLDNQTVIVKNGRILSIGKDSDIEIPSGAQVIEARGKYLLPGLADMHVHLSYEEELSLLVANGVTTVRNMGGTPWHLQLRERIQQGKLLGPHFTTAGPAMQSGSFPMPLDFFENVRTPAEARESVRRQKKEGYDYIKVHKLITNEAYQAIVETAAEVGLPVIGHVPERVAPETVIRARQQSIEHLTGYDDDYPRSLERLIDLTLNAGIWNCFTLSPVWNGENVEALQSHEPEEIKYVPFRTRAQWRRSRAKVRQYGNYEKILKGLDEHGAKLMLGTDTITAYSVAGFAVHRELELAVKAGLTPYQSLRYATVAPAEYLGLENDAGTVQPGRRADLLLLDANPLSNIQNTRQIAGVMRDGIYMPKPALQKMLDEVAAKYSRR
jgi:imidazolonepropionase-like amidohydrolase